MLIVLVSATGAQTQPRPEALPSAKQWKQTIGDWVVACSQVSEKRKTCVMSQTLASAKTRQPLAVWSIGKDSAGKLMGTMQMPVGVSLIAGVQVGIENQGSFSVPYSTCLRLGCFAPFEVTGPLLGQIQKSSKVTAGVHTAQQGALSLEFSLRGFPKAYETYLQESK